MIQNLLKICIKFQIHRINKRAYITVKESEYFCVPARSYKVLNYYNIYPSFEKTCDNKKDYPKNEATIKMYDEHNSPLKFKNKIAYSFQI